VEFIAPSEYMLRPPQPAIFLFVLDVSFNAIETGYLHLVCKLLKENLEKMPGDLRTLIGFITFDSTVHFYSLKSKLSQPQMNIVSDLEDIFLPSPDDLLVNLNESKELVTQLLDSLPSMFNNSHNVYSATGAALQAALKLVVSTCRHLRHYGGLMVSVLVSRSSSPGSNPCRGHCDSYAHM